MEVIKRQCGHIGLIPKLFTFSLIFIPATLSPFHESLLKALLPLLMDPRPLSVRKRAYIALCKSTFSLLPFISLPQFLSPILPSLPLLDASLNFSPHPLSPQPLTPSPYPLSSPPLLTPSPHPLSSPPLLTPSPHPLSSPPLLTTSPHHLSSPPLLTTSPHPLSSPPLLTPSPHPLSSPPLLNPSPQSLLSTFLLLPPSLPS